MESLSALIEGQRRSFKQFERTITNFQQKPIEAKTKGYIQSMLEYSETTFKSLQQTHNEVLRIVAEQTIREEDVPYLIEDTYMQFQDSFISFKAHLLDLTYEFQNPQLPEVNASTFATQNRSETFLSSPRLPKIDLPKFSGDYIDWIPYRDMFLTLVHNNQSLTKVQKYFYLKDSCTGTPLEIIKQYLCSESSYDLAWTALNDRYHNTRKLVDQILHRLLTTAPTENSSTKVKVLLDTCRSCVSLLNTLKIKTDSWDPILTYLIGQKLDSKIRTEWERSLNASPSIPSFSSLLAFLETTFRTLECIEEASAFSSKPTKPAYGKTKLYSTNTNYQAANATSGSGPSCPQCQNKHPLYKCLSFTSLSEAEKKKLLSTHRLCHNCLSKGHMHNECKSKHRCRVCSKPHHTILHNLFSAGHSVHTQFVADKNTNETNFQSEETSNKEASSALANLTFLNTTVSPQVLLATVLVFLRWNNQLFKLKALVDQGAQASFITEDAARLFGLKQIRTSASIYGISGSKSAVVKRCVQLQLHSQYEKGRTLTVNALVLPTLTAYRPNVVNGFHIPDTGDKQLADPNYFKPEKIDLIFGADVYGELLLSGAQKLKEGIFLQETIFGWMVSGPLKKSVVQSTIQINICSLERQLRQFWEQEELIEPTPPSPEEDACEKYFQSTFSRDTTGRYIVYLPFKRLLLENQLPNFQGTHLNALKRFNQIEKSFKARPQYAVEYKRFMKDYETLGHMEKIGSYPNDIPPQSYFLPHHGVMREESSTTKLRVVFDGGNLSTNSTSLNSELSAGPKLQNDLIAILLRWRCFTIAFKADIEKMFRQINICHEHQPFQCILWRDSQLHELCIYKLRTVTYGTTSAPYLSIRVLQQLSHDERHIFSKASQILFSDTYVDDIISGADNLADAIQLRMDLSQLLNKGQFCLRKWSTNSLSLFHSIPKELREGNDSISFQQPNFVKALGIDWDPTNDMFFFKFNFSFSEHITKSSVLSDASKLFDPFGWLAPTTIISKIIFQNLWLAGIDWCDPLPSELEKEWITYRSSLKLLEKIRIKRWFKCSHSCQIELHAFSDASQKAYAAVVYMSVLQQDGTYHVSLVQSKTKVAPLKTVTIPRLELCAATLLAKLVDKIIQTLTVKINKITYWTDSTTVLSWIRGNSSKWAVYVANRVATIQRLTNVQDWKYISTKENPADCASRGVQPADLIQHSLWWRGPAWLSKPTSAWPKAEIKQFQTNLELRPCNKLALITISAEYPEFLTRYSTIRRCIRVLAVILRFSFNARAHRRRTEKLTGFLTTAELLKAHNRIIELGQQVSFSQDLSRKANRKPIDLSRITAKLYALSRF